MNNSSVIHWEEPQRQSPAAIFIILLKTGVALLKTFWPALLVIVFRKREEDDSNVILYMILVFAALTLITAILNYFYYTFYVKDNNLVINSGFFKRKVTTLPLRNIIAVHLEQSVWQRVLKVMKVKIDSAGSEKVEVKIDALALHKAAAFREYLLNENQGTVITDAPAQSYKLSTVDLLKLSITANHLEAFFILLAVGINLVEDLKRALNIDGWELAGQYAGNAAAGVITMMVVLVAILSVIISAGRTIMRFFGFSLIQSPQGWKVQYGLLNRVQQVVPYQKVQLLSWRANLLRRKLNLWMLRVHSAGHTETKGKQHIAIPVTSEQKVWELVSFYLDPPEAIEEGKKISHKYVRRKIWVAALPVSVIITVVAWIWLGLPGLMFILLFPVMCWYYSRWKKNFRFVYNDKGIKVRSGVWGRRYTILAWKKVQQLEERRSLYQQRHGLGTLVFHTAGGKVKVPYVMEGEGNRIIDLVLYFVESDPETWK